jgi:hypothetical protein
VNGTSRSIVGVGALALALLALLEGGLHRSAAGSAKLARDLAPRVSALLAGVE